MDSWPSPARPRQRPAHPQEHPKDREPDQRVEPIAVALMRREPPAVVAQRDTRPDPDVAAKAEAATDA